MVSGLRRRLFLEGAAGERRERAKATKAIPGTRFGISWPQTFMTLTPLSTTGMDSEWRGI